MAKATFKLPEDFLLKLSRLGDRTDDIVSEVLAAGGEVVKDKALSNLRSVIGRDTKYPSRSTGQLEAALGVSKARQDRDGNFNVKIGFAENRTDGESNAKLATILEYGKSGQAPKPFLKPAAASSKKAAIEAMRIKLDEELSKI